MWLSLGVKNALLGRVGVVAGVFEEKCLGVNGGAKSASTWLALVSLGWVVVVVVVVGGCLEGQWVCRCGAAGLRFCIHFWRDAETESC